MVYLADSYYPYDVAVIGAGSWGTALAMQLLRVEQKVVLWARDVDHLSSIELHLENRRYLPGLAIPSKLATEPDIKSAVSSAQHILLACPSHALADTLRTIKPLIEASVGVIWACKGFEPGSGRLLHVMAREIMGPERDLAVITGPSFAKEVALDLPTAVTVAASTEAFGERVAALLHGGSFRAYYTADMVGAELGGAAKNVMAIATGICDGMDLGANERAGLITRGLGEMMRIGYAMGARQETLIGLAGMGDLVLTCTGNLSRNRQLGLSLGKGLSTQVAMDSIGQVVEGYKAALEVNRLRKKYQLDLPICEQIHGILYSDWNPQKSLRVLLKRELKKEY